MVVKLQVEFLTQPLTPPPPPSHTYNLTPPSFAQNLILKPPGGHNVIAGIYDYIKKVHKDSVMVGFLDGPQGRLLTNTHPLNLLILLNPPYQHTLYTPY